MSKLLVVDGNSIVNRAFYGIRDLSAPDGTPTNALYGMVNILKKHISALHPDYAAVGFDLKAPTFRHKIYGDYKAGRHAPPPELITQLGLSRDLASALGFRVLELEGYEADDILGTVSAMAEKEGCESYILTGDRDALQLIGDKTKVILAGNKEDVIYDPETFAGKYGVTPEKFVELKAMMGDSSDNIPGITGVGEKTALDLLGRFGSVEGLYRDYENSDLRPKLKEKIAASKDDALLSRVLVEIKRDVPLGITLSDCAFKGPTEDLVPLFTKLGFSRFINELSAGQFSATGTGAPAKEEPAAAEVTDLDKNDIKEIPGESLSVYDDPEDGRVYISNGEGVWSLSGPERLAGLLKDKKVSVYDAKTFYKKYGIKAGFDVMLGEYVLNSLNGQKSVPDICASYFGYIPSGGGDICLAVYKIAEKMNGEFSDGEMKLFYEIELPLAFVLADMENEGFLVDTDGLREFGRELDGAIEEYKSRIYEYSGREFNINSPKQLGEVLFGEDGLGLPAAKKTKSGYSTSAEVLEGLYAAHPIIPLILEYRAAAKLKSTYADGLLAAAGEDGRVHTNFNQNITATGRLSSTEPNLQNIPVRTELGRRMRKYFIAPEGKKPIDADYSQIELRILAAVSKDANMIDAFERGVDIHTATAASAFGIAEEFVTPELRKRAKAINFGIVYGIGEFSLAKDIGSTVRQAGEYIRNYLSVFSGVKRYLEKTVKDAKEKGYAETVTGRKRYIPELASSRRQMQAFGERVAKNSPIQGAAADIIKKAMISVSRALEKDCPEAKLILQVHDELIVEAPDEYAEKAAQILKREMENAIELPVKLTVDIKTAQNWFDAH